MHQPFETVRGGHFHLIVDALENQVGHNTLQGAVLRLYKVNVLRPDDHIHRLIIAKSLVNTCKAGAEDFYQFVPDHGAGYNIALTDEVGHKRIFRLIINLLRGSHLLDVSLVHDHDGVRHGQSLLLVMGHIDKGNSQLILKAYQLVLHILAQL